MKHDPIDAKHVVYYQGGWNVLDVKQFRIIRVFAARDGQKRRHISSLTNFSSAIL